MGTFNKKEVKETILKLALLNALRHGGNAQPKPVLGKFLGENQHLREKIDAVSILVNEVVQEINALSSEKQQSILEKKWPATLVTNTEKKQRSLPPLHNVAKYRQIITRFSPNPDFVLHLGSARAIILSYEYAKMYNGLFYLRFEDTDPKLKKPRLRFYDAIREDLLWLRCNWDSEFIQSDRLSIYYDYADKILRSNNAYVCVCERKAFQDQVRLKQPCPCRSLTPNENLERWHQMLNGQYAEGDAVVRIKTDLTHSNPAVRDWPALRIIDTKRYPHPRVGRKYVVWPLYNFACGVDDHLLNVTHIIRGKEHLTNQMRQEYMYRAFGWKYPDTVHYGRLKIVGASLSKSQILRDLRNGLYKHWDDPRLATLAALRRRGITPESIRRLILAVGPKPVDISLSWKNLYAYNRKIVDPLAYRYFFVRDPMKVTVNNVLESLSVQIPLHPDNPSSGSRSFEVVSVNGKAHFLVSSDDKKILRKGRTVRFMSLFNIRVDEAEDKEVQTVFYSESYTEAKTIKAPLIHWLPESNGIPCEVVMPDASIVTGVAEEACKTLSPNKIVQFERFGFVRVDEIDKTLTVYFAHR